MVFVDAYFLFLDWNIISFIFELLLCLLKCAKLELSCSILWSTFFSTSNISFFFFNYAALCYSFWAFSTNLFFDRF